VGSSPTPRTCDGLIAVLWELKKQGRKDSTLACMGRRLNYLARQVDLKNPENVKEFIAGLNCTDGFKDNLIDVYSHYAAYYKIAWQKPKYMREERITKVPHEEDINKIISHATLKYATAYSILRDVGLRPVELGMLKVKDFDLETGEVYPTTAKHGAGRVLKVRPSTLAMLKKYINKKNLTLTDVLFSTKRVKENWSKLKGVIAQKLNEPQLRQIWLYDLRHYAGSMTYNKTKDIIFTMRFLGHGNTKEPCVVRL